MCVPHLRDRRRPRAGADPHLTGLVVADTDLLGADPVRQHTIAGDSTSIEERHADHRRAQ